MTLRHSSVETSKKLGSRRKQSLNGDIRQFLDVLRPVTPAETAKIIAESAAKHSSMHPTSTWLVKQLSSSPAQTISHMCNASLTSQKHALFKPGLKKPNLNQEDLNSYIPLSNLSFISKTIERVVALRFREHCEAHSVLPVCQSAYRAHHSIIETAVAIFHKNIVRIIEPKRHVSVLVLLDLNAAFDTVDDKLLLDTLERRFGMQDMALSGIPHILQNERKLFKSEQISRRSFLSTAVCLKVPSWDH